MTAYNRFSLARIREKGRQYLLRAVALADVGILQHEHFTCPICFYNGSFVPVRIRHNAMCPRCGSLERHRLQALVLERLQKEGKLKLSMTRCLQFAPDVTSRILKPSCQTYTGADIAAKAGQIKLDITSIDLPSESFDLVYASHVLEHIPNDHGRFERDKSCAEARRPCYSSCARHHRRDHRIRRA
jgi:hypothetical protein